MPMDRAEVVQQLEICPGDLGQPPGMGLICGQQIDPSLGIELSRTLSDLDLLLLPCIHLSIHLSFISQSHFHDRLLFVP